MKNDIVMIIFKTGQNSSVEFCPVGRIVYAILYYFVSNVL